MVRRKTETLARRDTVPETAGASTGTTAAVRKELVEARSRPAESPSGGERDKKKPSPFMGWA